MTKTTLRLNAAVTAACVAMAMSALSSSVHAQAAPAGWTPAWSDEFNGTTLNTQRWENLNRRDSFNEEKQYYTPSQVAVNNGQLKITASNQPLDGKAYRSGLVRTWGEQTFGRWEVKASLPATQGMWPAIWLLPRFANWPTGGEIDIMENRGSEPTIVGSAYHYGSSVATHDYKFKNFSYSVNNTPVSFHNSMHTYAVEWDQARIRYIIDGVPSWTFYRNTAPISSTPMSLILNLAVGGMFGGDPNASTQFPQTLAVDYVRVFDRDTGTSGLENGSFEDRSGVLYHGWDEYSHGANVGADSVAANARTGNSAVQMYGRFNGSADNTSGLFQEVPTTPGEVWQVGAHGQNRPGDKLAGNNNARIRIEFIDENGAVIDENGAAAGSGAGQLRLVDANSPTEYREGVVRRTAPLGAKFARAVLEMQQLSNAGGAMNFDDASLRRWTAAATAGDINLDGTRNAADLDALLHSLTAANTAFNFNGDASVSDADVDALLASAFGTKRGDANLDRAVNFADLVVLAQNYNAVGTGHWAIGDFTGDSNVNFADLVVLAQNYNSGTGGVSAAAFESDWALAQSIAQSAVPEPAAMLACSVGLAAMSRRRRASK